MKNRKGFAFLEFILVVVIIGLLAAVFIPATARIRERARDDVITKQLSNIIRKGDAYMQEKDLKNVGYKALVDAKIVEPATSISGEKYEDIVLQKSGGTIILKKNDGKEIIKNY